MALYSYAGTQALPCRTCGSGFKDIDPIVMYKDRRFHEKCFVCGNCKVLLNTDAHPQSVGNLPYCNACFPRANLKLCGACKEPINDAFISIPGISHDFHEQCFRCEFCQTSILHGYLKRNNKLLCHACSRSPQARGDTITQQTQSKQAAATYKPTNLDALAATKGKFCGQCGAAKPTSTSKFCSNCGSSFLS